MGQGRLSGLVRSIAHTLAAVFSGSAAFRKAWKSSACRTEGIEGRWQGEWVSEVNGHHGELKGVLSKAGAEQYRAVFHATYSKFLRVSYAVNLIGQQENGGVELEGEADLGRLAGGVYHYAGKATLDEFNCRYECRYDRGRFQMQRVGGEPGSCPSLNVDAQLKSSQ